MTTDALGPGLRRGGKPLEARALACSRGERVLFAGLDLAVARGDVVWLRAANGFGKTTLLRVLAGLAKPHAGTVTRAGTPLYLAHANALKDDLTVAESIAFSARLAGQSADAATLRRALADVDIDAKRDAPVRSLSQGQKRRVALARLALSPADATWLLDEPYDALDADGARRVGALLATHAARGGCAVLTSHVPPDTGGASLRVLALDD